MGGKHSRDKGARFERKIASAFKEIYETSRRGVGQSQGGDVAADVEIPTFWVECKHHAVTNIKRALSQAASYVRQRKLNKWPLAVTKDDGKPIMATMYFDDFMKLASEYELLKMERDLLSWKIDDIKDRQCNM